jgi:hypothetical protein
MISIIDMSTVGITEIPTSLLKRMMVLLQRNFRGRLYKLFVLHTPLLIKGLWSIAKAFLDRFTIAKINLLRSDFSQIYEYVDKSILEEKFGGGKPNRKDNFWPLLPKNFNESLC